jgi:hypothetical protein
MCNGHAWIVICKLFVFVSSKSCITFKRKKKWWKNDLAYLKLVLDEGGVVVTVKIVACRWWCGFFFEFSFFYIKKFLSFFISSFSSTTSWFRTPHFSTQIFSLSLSLFFRFSHIFFFFLPLIFSFTSLILNSHFFLALFRYFLYLVWLLLFLTLLLHL